MKVVIRDERIYAIFIHSWSISHQNVNISVKINDFFEKMSISDIFFSTFVTWQIKSRLNIVIAKEKRLNHINRNSSDLKSRFTIYNVDCFHLVFWGYTGYYSSENVPCFFLSLYNFSYENCIILK